MNPLDPAPRALIFDFNGVLADDEDLHRGSFAAVLAEHGVTLTAEKYYERYLGMPDPACFENAWRDELGTELDPDLRTELIARKGRVYMELLGETLPLMEGAAELVGAAASRWTLAVVSGAERHEIEHLLGAFDLLRFFSVVVSGNDTERGKPHPDGYLKGLEGLRALPHLADLRAEECLVFEDAPLGVDAAQAAGMRCIGVATTSPAERLAHADAVVARTSDLETALLI